MRTIKFRAWDKKKKGWKGLWIFRGGHVGQYDVSNEKIDILDLTKRWENVELEQFTGLQDKNGKDIYEGDILARMPNDFQPEYKGAWIVDFEGGTFIAKCKNGNDSHWLPYWSYDIFAQVEVIGNIHENQNKIK